MSNVIIKVSSISKDFRLPHQKAGSIKNIFTNVFSFRRQTFEIQHALEDISFDIEKGEFFGIVGRNGSGKSTLLKILAGIYQPTKGSVDIGGRVVPFIELGVGFNGELTGRENIYLNGALLGFSESEISKKYQSIIDFAELERFIDQKLKNYSSGMQVRLAFSVATVLAESEILLIDEVLAVGDSAFQRKCLDYFKELKRQGKTVVFVSHDMGAIQQYCDRAALIEKSKLVEIGRPAAIASKYQKMFTEDAKRKDAEYRNISGKIGISGEERWGDGLAEIVSVAAILEGETNKEGSGRVVIRAKVRAHADIEKPIIGFSIKNLQLSQLFGTNTQRRKHVMRSMKKGDVCNIEWQVDNIFNEGTYYVDSTIAYDQATNVADRWPDATSFKIYREDSTVYQVLPEINVKTSYS